jgi:hypothetical protein
VLAAAARSSLRRCLTVEQLSDRHVALRRAQETKHTCQMMLQRHNLRRREKLLLGNAAAAAIAADEEAAGGGQGESY